MAAYPQFITGISVVYQGGATFAQFNRDVGNASQRIRQSTGQMSRQVSGDVQQVSDRFRGLALAAQTAQGPFSSLGTRFNAISRSLDELGGKLGGTLAALAGGGFLLSTTTAFQSYTALLRSTTESEREFQSALAATFGIAERSRTSLEGTVRLYARLKPIADEVGVGFQQLGSIVQTANKSIVLSGSTAQEATAAMIQFSQALSSGKLSGDEFRSLGENANFLRRTIAEGIVRGGLVEGFDGTFGALKKLADDQKLTTDIIIQALTIMEGQVDESFSRMPLTISQAGTQIQTSVLSLINTFEQTTGGLQLIAKGMVLLADNMGLVAALAAPLAARFLGITTGLAAIAAAARGAGIAIGTGLGVQSTAATRALLTLGVSANVLRTNVINLQAAQVSGSAAAIAWARAQNIAAASASALGAASRGLLAVLGGPLGAAITALTIGLTLLATRKTQVAAAADQMGISEGELRQRLEETSGAIAGQNALLLENSRLKRQKAFDDAAALASGAGRNAALAINSSLATKTAFSGVDKDAARKIADDLAAGRTDADAAFRALEKAGLKDPRVTEALLGVQAAQLAKDFQTDKALKENASALGPNFGGIRAARGGAAAKDGAALIRDAKLAAQAEDALAEKKRLRAQADIAINTIARDAKLTEAEKSVQIEAAERSYIAQAAAVDARTKAEKEAAAAARVSARESKAQETAAESLAKKQERLNLSAREAAEGFEALTEAQRIAERAGDALRRVNDAQAAGGLGKDEAEALRRRIQEGAAAQIRQPITDIEDSLETEQAILNELLAGRETEAELLRIKLDLSRRGVELNEQDEQAIRGRLEQIRQENLALNERNQLVDIYASAAGRVQGAARNLIRSGLDGRPQVGNFLKDLTDGFKDTLADELSVKLFGDQEAAARERMVNATNTNVDALKANTEALLTAAGFGSAGRADPAAPPGSPASRSGVFGGLVAAITGPLERLGIIQKKAADTQEQAARKRDGSLPGTTTDAYNRIGSSFAQALGLEGPAGDVLSSLGNTLKAYATADAFTKALGIRGKAGEGIRYAAAGQQVGGDIGEAIGGEYGKAIGQSIGRTAGFLLGIVGPTRRAYENVSVGADGSLISSSGGSRGRDSANSKGVASSLSASLIELLNDAVGALGGSLRPGQLGTLGPVGDQFLFSPDAASGGSVKTNVQKFGTPEEAIQAAIRSALDRGLIEGIRASTSRLLKVGADFERQLDKAVKFEDVFKRLRSFTDPTGQAIDELNKEFEGLRRIFDEAGASAQEYQDLQKLYDLEREEAIRQSQSRISQSLRQLIDDLTIGDNGLSLRDRRANAQTEFDRFNTDAAIRADPEGFTEAARALLEIERELFGSRSAYFDRFDQILETSRRVLGGESSALPPAFNVGERALDTKPITDSLGGLGDRIVGSIDGLSEAVIRWMSSGGGGGGEFGYAPIVQRQSAF